MNKSSQPFITIFLVLTALMVCACFSTVPAFSQNAVQTIQLKDGTSLQGRLIAIEGDDYIIDSPLLGEVAVSRADVLTISAQPAPSPASSGSASAGSGFSGRDGQLDQLEAFQRQVLQSLLQNQKAGSLPAGLSGLINETLMSEMTTLLSDPQIQQLLSDPRLQQDLMSMDIQKIQNNPRFQQLMQNPQIQAIIQKLSTQMMNATLP